jgi:HSP20 family protein
MTDSATKIPVEARKTGSLNVTPTPAIWQPLSSLRREMERLFDDFDGGRWFQPFRSWEVEPFSSANPALDVVEKTGLIEVTAELPGLEAKDVEVSVTDDGLTIKGEKREETTEEKEGYHVQERRFGSFSRFVRLPDGIVADKAEASFRNGVLTVKLPRDGQAHKPRTIKVKAA